MRMRVLLSATMQVQSWAGMRMPLKPSWLVHLCVRLSVQALVSVTMSMCLVRAQESGTLVERTVVKVLLGAPEAASRLLLEAEQAAADAGRPAR